MGTFFEEHKEKSEGITVKSEWFIKGCLKKRNKWCQRKLDRNTLLLKEIEND